MLSVALDTESVRKASEVAREMHSDAVRCTPGPLRSQTLYPTELWARGEERLVLAGVSPVNHTDTVPADGRLTELRAADAPADV